MKPGENVDISVIEDFFNAIVVQAAKDYVAAYKRYKANPESSEADRNLEIAEAFFFGEEYQRYTNVDGGYLVNRLRKAVDAGDKLFPRKYGFPSLRKNV